MVSNNHLFSSWYWTSSSQCRLVSPGLPYMSACTHVMMSSSASRTWLAPLGSSSMWFLILQQAGQSLCSGWRQRSKRESGSMQGFLRPRLKSGTCLLLWLSISLSNHKASSDARYGKETLPLYGKRCRFTLKRHGYREAINLDHQVINFHTSYCSSNTLKHLLKK